MLSFLADFTSLPPQQQQLGPALAVSMQTIFSQSSSPRSLIALALSDQGFQMTVLFEPDLLTVIDRPIPGSVSTQFEVVSTYNRSVSPVNRKC